MELLFELKGFTSLSDEVSKLNKSMNRSLKEAQKLQNDVQGSVWKGESKQEFLAFLDLVIQFHSSFVTTGTGPMQFNEEKMKEQVRAIDGFLKLCSVYTQLE